MKHRDTNRLLQRLQQAVSRPDLASHGIQLQHLGQVSGLPVVHVAIGHSSKPRVLVIAGTHGDEPASVEAAVQLLESFPVEWLHHF
ncbi:MAG: hypothetical protein HOB49_00825, partial [Gemmatimonadetes bacterium]|nr:hypothetical protein [Gemmatimonadota bacterium]